MSTIFNSLDRNFKTPTGPVAKDKLLTFRVKLPKSLEPTDVQLVIYEYCASQNRLTFQMEYEKTDDDTICFKVETSALGVNIYCYYFTFISFGQSKYLKMCEDPWEARILNNWIDGYDWQLTVYKPVKIHPNMCNGTMYHIFPDRFYKSGKTTNLPTDRIYRDWGEYPFFTDDKIGLDFFGGDIEGITQKLEYLKKLGVSVLYSNPTWESPSNHHFNAGLYTKVDPVLGNSDTLKNFIDTAHSNDMIVILDGVFNHVGSDSIYFNKNGRYPNKGAYDGPESPYYNWFYFNGNNRDSYACWWGINTLPKFNQDNPDYINEFYGIGGILAFWYKLGIDGIRLDVADELTNHTLYSIHNIAAHSLNYSHVTLIGEVWDNASNKCNYGHKMNYFLGNQLTSVMNYPVRDTLLEYLRYGSSENAYSLKRTMLSIFVEDYPYEIAHALMNFLSTHDKERAITYLGADPMPKEIESSKVREWQASHAILSAREYRLGRNRAMIGYFIISFLPGIPSIYYGDEIGLTGYGDPGCRRCFTWDHIDKKMLRFMRSLMKTRKSLSDFLATADFDVCEADTSKLIISRFSDTSMLLLFINRTGYAIPLDVSNYVSTSLTGRTATALLDISEKTGKTLSNIDCEVLFSHGKNSNLKSLDAYGGILVEVVFN